MKLTNPYSEEDLEVNQRSVLPVRAIGRGRSGLTTFTGFMGMLPPISQAHYISHTEQIRRQQKRRSQTCLRCCSLRKDAVPDEILTVTCKAAWQKRGHQSHYGVMVVASWETGQVLDIEVLSK